MSIFYSFIERRDFGNLLTSEGIASVQPQEIRNLRLALKVKPGAQTIVAIWADDPYESGQLPELLVCADGVRMDWIAWLTTYAKSLRPITAFSRVLEYDEASALDDPALTPSLDRLSWSAAGVVLGEVLASSRMADNLLDSLPSTAFTSTLSYSMFRSFALYRSTDQAREVVAAWDVVRDIAEQRERQLPAGLIANVCLTIFDAFGDAGEGKKSVKLQSEVMKCCKELLMYPNVAPRRLGSISGFQEAEAVMRGPRESRVVALDAFIRAVSKNREGEREVLSFAIGYLASQIAPGTIQHAGLLTSVVSEFPESLLWYGFCAGLWGGEQSELFGHRGRIGADMPHSARRILRDLLKKEGLLCRPSADVSFFELLALSRTGRGTIEAIPKASQSTLVVELQPGVDMTVNAANRPAHEQRSRTVRPEVIALMGDAIERLRRLHSDLTVEDRGVSRAASGRSIYEDKQPPKRSK